MSNFSFSGQTDINSLLLVISLLLGVGLPCSIETIEFFKGRLRPDAEAANVATGSDLKEVKAIHIDEGDTRDVTEGACDAVVLGVDDEGSTALDAAPVPHLTLTSAEATAVLDLQTNNKS